MYSITTDSSTTTLVLIIEHLGTYGIELTSSNYTDGVLSITTDLPLDSELIEHLELTVS
jgi:hypothetical protein